MIYQHEARGADKAITDAIDKHVDDERHQDDEGDDGPAGGPCPPNGPSAGSAPKRVKAQYSESASDLGLYVGSDDGNRTRTVSLGICRLCSIYAVLAAVQVFTEYP